MNEVKNVAKFKYSEQALVLLESMPNFDKEAFERWFESRLSIGSNNILEYLFYKKQMAEKKKQIEAETKQLEALENGNPK